MSSLVEILLHEYDALKAEQIERIKTRNAYMGATVLVVLAAAGGALQADQAALLLAIPPVCAVAGWYWLREDLQIIAIRRHLREELMPPLSQEAGAPVLRWEADDRSMASRIIQAVANLVTFVAPGLAAIVAWVAAAGRDLWPVFTSMAGSTIPLPMSTLFVTPVGWLGLAVAAGLTLICLHTFLIVYTAVKEKSPL
jgi:hypothetical protein